LESLKDAWNSGDKKSASTLLLDKIKKWIWKKNAYKLNGITIKQRALAKKCLITEIFLYRI